MKIFDYIFLLRPMLIIPVWTITLLGARAAEWRTRGTDPFTLDRYPFADFSVDDKQMLLTLLVATLLAGGVFILNQIYDIESDRQNKKLFLLPEGHVSPSEAWVLYILTTTVAIVGAFLLNWQMGFLFIAGAALGFQYSYPGLKLKEHSYKAFRNNVLGHGMLAFLFGWVMTMKAPGEFTQFNIEGILRSLSYCFAVGAVYLNTTLPDLEGDKATGKKTYALEWGLEKTLRISLTMTVVAVVLSAMTADYAMTISAAITLPFFWIAKTRKSISLATLASKVAILALSLFAAIYFPIYLAVVFVVIVATRIYYAARFSMQYPVLVEKDK